MKKKFIYYSNTAGWTMTEFDLGNSTDIKKQSIRSFELCVTSDYFGNSCENEQ